MSGLVLSELNGSIAGVTLNRPERHNSLIPEMLQELLDTLESLRAQPEVRALVLRANGRSFSTGGDVRAFYEHRSAIEPYARQVVGLLDEAILALVQFPVPVVAAVHGIVTGGSIGLVLACDLVLVAPETTFTPYYATVGYSPDGGWTAMLPAVIGTKRAAEVLLTDRPITAQEAVEWGMANRIVRAGKIVDEARAAAEQIALLTRGSETRAKRLLWGDVEGLAARLERERQEFVQQIASDEALQGMAAFLRPRKRAR